MPERLLTIREIAARLNLPESNVRYYRDRFEEYLPFVGAGRKRRYRPEALGVFEFIASELKRNSSSEQIAQALARLYPQNPMIDNPDDPSLSSSFPALAEGALTELVHTQARAMEQMSHALNAQRAHDKGAIEELEQRYGAMREALLAIWGEVKSLKQGELPSAQVSEFENHLAGLGQELAEQAARLGALESALRRDMAVLKEQMERCQFWTKRLVLQYRAK